MTVGGKDPAVKTPHSATFSSLVPCCIDTTIRKGDNKLNLVKIGNMHAHIIEIVKLWKQVIEKLNVFRAC